MKELDTFFVGIDKPAEVRLNILESSKEMIEILKHIERIKEIRGEKYQTLLELKTKLDDLNKLIRKLNQTLPKTALRQKANELKTKKKKTKAKKKKIIKPKIESKISELDKELIEVERQLAKLKK